MQMIGVAVSGLDRVDATLAAVAELGQRHGAYGVTGSTTTVLEPHYCGPSRKDWENNLHLR